MRGQLPGSKSLHSVLSWAIDVMQTPIRNESKRHSLVLALIIGTLCFSINQASAADIPSKYRGVWTAQESCEVSRLRTGEFPFLIVTDKTTKAHEQACKIAAVKLAAKTDALTFRCSGEGEEWELAQEWSVRDKATDIVGWMTIKEPVLVITDTGYKTTYRKCSYAVCVQDTCWGEQ
jgi:hypothetical protein